MDYKSLFWFFSTVAQSFAAILGISGTVFIFLLQNTNNEVKKLVQRVYNEFDNFGRSFWIKKVTTSEEIKEQAKKIHLEDDYFKDQPEHLKIAKEISLLLNKEKN